MAVDDSLISLFGYVEPYFPLVIFSFRLRCRPQRRWIYAGVLCPSQRGKSAIRNNLFRSLILSVISRTDLSSTKINRKLFVQLLQHFKLFFIKYVLNFVTFALELYRDVTLYLLFQTILFLNEFRLQVAKLHVQYILEKVQRINQIRISGLPGDRNMTRLLFLGIFIDVERLFCNSSRTLLSDWQTSNDEFNS